MNVVEQIRKVKNYLLPLDVKNWVKEVGYPCMSYKDNKYDITLCHYKEDNEVSLYFLDKTLNPTLPYSYVIGENDEPFIELRDKYLNSINEVCQLSEQEMRAKGYY